MLKKVLLVVLAFIMLAIPLLVRWFHFYDGQYEPGEVARPDLTEIEAPTSQITSFQDRVPASDPGAILVDAAHSNRFDMGDLSALQARLSARGQRLELLEAVDALDEQLRYAKALIVISPGADWTPEEIEQVQRFVVKGGRLLLIADPTRYGIAFDEFDIPVLDEDAPHINDLAARFGLLFQVDYLYNTADNAGNFRNIKLTDFASNDLTRGLSEIAFYAARSIVSEEPALVVTSGETRSSASERADALPVAVLAREDAVLALGDLTFMAEPYNATYDNGRFVANIADFLSGAQREYELADFPYFFDDEADLVYAGAPLLDSDLLQGGSALQTLFADVGKELALREAEDPRVDTIFLGLFAEAEEVEPYLEAAQVTLCITPTRERSEAGDSLDVDEAKIATTPTPTPTEPPTATSGVTPTLEITVTPGVATEEITATAQISPPVQCQIRIESLGEMVVTGTSLLLLHSEGERQVLLVLADTEIGLGTAGERLTTGDLQDCLFRETEAPALTTLALCPTGEIATGDGGGGWQEPEPEPAPEEPAPVVTDTVEPSEPDGEPEGSIIVVALDHGEGRYDGMTSAADYEAILSERFDVTVWSTEQEGLPETDSLLDYDLVIWTSGDFEAPLENEESDAVFLVMLEGIPVLLSGAYIGDTNTEALQRDIQVFDAGHPIADGFETDEVIRFVAAPSGSDYETGVLEALDENDEGLFVPFARGPDSQETGAPSVFVMDDELTQARIAFIGFPLYLLPEAAKSRLVLNTVDWMLNP